MKEKPQTEGSLPVTVTAGCKGSRNFKVVRWHKKSGDAVNRGERLLEIETEKAVLEIESPRTGTVTAILVAVGQSCPARSAVAHIRAQ